MSNNANINWYPGHMAKTKKQIMQDLSMIDVVVELLDARIPVASRNPDIQEMTKNKKRLIILNKCDLADEEETKKWVSYFEKQGIPAIATDANTGAGIKNLIPKVEALMEEEKKKQSEKGRVGRAIRMMILGIPNVGKSSLINRLSKKVTAKVGNKPGVTVAKQWIRIGQTIELLDTPGVLWPKFENEEIAFHLAYTGTIKDEILERTEIAFSLLRYLLTEYKEIVIERYHLEKEVVDEMLENQAQDSNANIYDIMQLIGKKRGAIIAGGRVDDEKTSAILLDDFRTGKLGRITVEKVPKNEVKK